MIGNSWVKTSERQIAVAGLSTAHGSYRSTSYTGDIGVGYRYVLPKNLYIIPGVGISAASFSDGGYTEKDGAYNRTFSKKTGKSFSGTFGVTGGTSFAVGEGVFMPSFFAKVRQDFGGKSPEVMMKFNGQGGDGFIIKSKAPYKTSFTFGTDLTMKSGNMEYGLSYNATSAKKFIAHTGVLKVKVNF